MPTRRTVRRRLRLPLLPLLCAACVGAVGSAGAIDAGDAGQTARGVEPKLARGVEPTRARGVEPTRARELPPLRLGGHVFHRRVLANGLHAAAVRDASDPAGGVSVFVVVGAGERHETPATGGLAHLVEHAMYAGTARTPAGEHDRLVRTWGGESNAFTRADYTLFYDHGVPAERLDDVLTLEADRLRGLTFDESAVRHERERLREEEQETFGPDHRRDELLESLVYRVHPYRAGTLDAAGNTAAVGLDVEAVRAFYDRHYGPSRTAVVVVGPTEESAALDAIESAFGSLPPGPPPAAVPQEPPVEGARLYRVPWSNPRDRCEAVWIVPALGHPDRPALEVLARVLSGGSTPEGTPLQAQVGSRVDRELFRVAATGEGACAAVEAAVASARAGEIDAGEVRRVRARLRDDYETLPLRARPYFSLAAEYGVMAVLGHLEELTGHAAAIDAATPEEVARVAREHLPPGRRTLVVFEGEGGAPEPLPDDPKALAAAAQEASAAGDFDRAEAALTRLLDLDESPMRRVIHLASRGQVRMERRDWDGAIADFERALQLVDYPAVRDLLREAEARRAAADLRAPRRDGDADAPPLAASPGEPAAEAPDDPEAGEPDLHGRLDAARAELERWRGLAFRAPVELELVASVEDEKLGGWYEPSTGRLVVVEGRSARFSRAALLHELHHALQDQHFDLSALHEAAPDDDARQALECLVEGEAMLAVAERFDYDFERHAVVPASGPVERDRFDKIQRYGAGLRFVRALRERGGWPAVDAAFRAPPRTTAEIYHPERFPAPPPATLARPLAPELAGGTVREDGRRGELELRWLLVAHAPTRAQAAELGGAWVADRLRTVEAADGRHLQWDVRFSDAEAAARFVATGAAEAAGWRAGREGRDVRLLRRE